MGFHLSFPASAGLKTDTNTKLVSFQPLRAPKSEAQNQNGVSKGSSEYLGTHKNMFADSVPNIMTQLRPSSSEKNHRLLTAQFAVSDWSLVAPVYFVKELAILTRIW